MHVVENGERPWVRHYPEEVAPAADYPKHNVAQLLIQAAVQYPNRTAVHFMGANLSYQQLLDAAYRFANGLHALGIKSGDRVALMLPNCPHMVIAYYGSLLAGAVVVMTNPLYMEGELIHQLNDVGAKVIVTLDMLLPRVRQVKRSTPLTYLICGSLRDYLPLPLRFLYPLKAKKEGHSLHIPNEPGLFRFKSWLKSSTPQPVLCPVDAENDIAMLQYTGGTTGTAKGVMLTHYNLVANTVQTANWCYKANRGEERFLAVLPCFHVFGLTVLLNQAMHLAGELVLLPRFDTLQVLAAIQKKKITVFPGAPTMYIAINHHKEVQRFDLSSVKVCVSGSAALPLEVQERFEALTGGRLIEGYGLTEASPVTHANPIWGLRKTGTIGIPFPDTDAKVVHPEPLPPGEIGELAVKGPQVMKGYWNRPEDTAAVLKDGWLLTGDMAKMDEDGYFMIVDRKKDMINASGFKVYPRDVEEMLFEHPAVKEAVVIGVPDPYRGETVKAFIVRAEGAGTTAEELEAWCRERLAAYKVPRLYEFREELPKTMVGKVLRRRLAEDERQRQAGGGQAEPPGSGKQE
ncbi:long-chain fatty acid--CoA ligase [Paenibacillus melissococcoides]|uniref:Long-chain fatty acid--CoA ligase n=1 Tax=Paenibacillus melissococcoides TaxID=2912268 RepID=A0ABM9FXE6_9BACL|nr:long-chain fatty acid--CoA ligase [Paenibacillus melissococcoides]CAH8243864.1 long-chain fatty acid--CoA ligase [Paenibacillus melissococcoides]